MSERRLTKVELERLRRSYAMTAQLPAAELAWLLDEAAELIDDREQLRRLVAGLTGPWSEVRTALNELHRLAS